MQLRTITSTDTRDFNAWCAVYAAAMLADGPGGPKWTERELKILHRPHNHRDVVLWLAEEDGEAVGAAAAALHLRDNLHLVELDIFVAPHARRRGVGSALLHVIEDEARARGRTSMLLFVSGGNDASGTPGILFAEHHGLSHRLTEVRRVQRPPFPFGEIDQAVQEARPFATGYEIVNWRDAAPDTVVDEYARLEARLSTDAPLGAMEYEGEVWDAARIRASERRAAEMGRGLWCAAAMSANGVMAGLTVIAAAHDSDLDAYQGTTIVDPNHRGRRLGILLKAANLAAFTAERPGVERIWTWNAESNTQMIAINETMGYRVQGWEMGFQRNIDVS